MGEPRKPGGARHAVWACAIALCAGGALVLISPPGHAAASPDLVVTKVSTPPPARPPGGAFRVTDTVTNRGKIKAGKSVTRYYLSRNTKLDGRDIRLGGRRSVPRLGRGERSSGRTRVTVPASTPPASYFVLACADDLKRMAESDERNNCRASASQVSVEIPRLASLGVVAEPRDTTAGEAILDVDGNPIEVRLLDQFGTPFVSSGIVIEATDPEGNLEPQGVPPSAPRATTNTSGVARFPADGGTGGRARLEIRTADVYALTFQAPDEDDVAGGTDQFQVVTTGNVATMGLENEPADTVAGNHIRSTANEDLRVEVRDEFGNPIEGVTVTPVVEAGPPGGSLTEAVSAETDGDGFATFTDTPGSRLVIEAAGLGYALGFTTGGMSAPSAEFSVLPGSVAQVTLLNQPAAEVVAGEHITDGTSAALQVLVRDAFGNGTPDQGVRVTDNRGRLLGTPTTVTDYDGIAVFPDDGFSPRLIIRVAGTGYALNFRVTGTTVSDTSDPFTVHPADPDALVIVNAVAGPVGGQVEAGEHIFFQDGAGNAEDARILVRDRFGNPVPGVVVTATAEPNDLADPAEATTDASGVATFTDEPGSRLAITDVGPGNVLEFAVGGLAPAQSDAFDVV